MPDLWVSDCSSDTVSSSPQDEEAKGRPAGTRQCPLGLCSPSPFLPGSGRPSNGSPCLFCTRSHLPGWRVLPPGMNHLCRTSRKSLPPLNPLSFSTPAACDVLPNRRRPSRRTPSIRIRMRSDRGLVPRCKGTGHHKLTKIKCLSKLVYRVAPLYPCAGPPVKVFGRVGHGEGEPFSKKVSLSANFSTKTKKSPAVPGTIRITCRARNLS